MGTKRGLAIKIRPINSNKIVKPINNSVLGDKYNERRKCISMHLVRKQVHYGNKMNNSSNITNSTWYIVIH